MNRPLPDFSNADRRLVETPLDKRHGTRVEVDLADAQLSLDASDEQTMRCPTLYWRRRGARFVVFRIADGRYRRQFFDTDADHRGTGRSNRSFSPKVALQHHSRPR